MENAKENAPLVAAFGERFPQVNVPNSNRDLYQQ